MKTKQNKTKKTEALKQKSFLLPFCFIGQSAIPTRVWHKAAKTVRNGCLPRETALQGPSSVIPFAGQETPDSHPELQ